MGCSVQCTYGVFSIRKKIDPGMRSVTALKLWLLDDDPRTRFRHQMLGLAAVGSILSFILFYSNLALIYYFSPMRTNPPGHVVILTTSWCPFCRSLRQALDSAGMPYETIDIEKDWKSSYAHYSTKQRGIPVTVIGSTVVGGGLRRQLAAIRQLCDQMNPIGHYDCARLVAPGS